MAPPTNGKCTMRTSRRPLVSTRRSGTDASRNTPMARPSQSLEAPAKITVPSAVAGTAPAMKRSVTPPWNSPRLHQIRERLPSSIVIVRTGTAARMPSVHAATGSRRRPAPKPATPPIVEPRSAVATRIIHVSGSGMPCHHTPMIRWAAAAGACVVSLDSTMNIAFPAIAAAFAVPPERVRWVIICYVLVYAVTSLAGGALADRVGHGRVFRAGLLLSIVAFAMGALAPTFGWLLVARVVQGLGGGCVYGTSPGLVTLGVPAARRGRALGFLGAAMGLGFSAGPLVAGVLVDVFGWAAVFHLRLPLALATLAWAWVSVPAAPSPRAPRLVAARDLLRRPVLVAGALSFVANA